MGTTALVLNGGSIRGAFQVGAIKAILEKGYKFDSIFGISVGSLNGSFMINEAGKQGGTKDSLNWEQIGNNLASFWLENIKKPENIAEERKPLALFRSLRTENFKGLVDTGPLHTLVRNTLKLEYLQKSSVKLTIGAVNIADGEIVYVDPSSPNFIDYILASTAIPIMMPYLNIGGNASQTFFDGGIRDIAPLNNAIKSGADEIVCVSCHSKKLGGSAGNFKNLMTLANRVMEIIENEMINADIERAETCNKYLNEDGSKETEGPLTGCRRVKLTVIQPLQPINLDLVDFNKEKIREIIDSGYQTAMEKLG